MNTTQGLLILIAVLGAISTGTAQLTDVFGAGVAHTIVSVASLVNTIISSVMIPLTGNVAQIKNVAALDGVKVKVTPDASAAIAAVAVDPNQPNVGALNQADRPALQQKAQS